MLRFFLGLVVLLSALGAALFFQLESRVLPQFAEAPTKLPVGVFHVHSDLSHDGRLSVDDIVATAKDEGYGFLILTDHNIQLPAPMERDGVVVLSHAEVSTPFGHVVNLGGEYALSKTQQDALNVFDLLAQSNGSPILSHPSDPKRPWTGPWQGAAGVEITNVASNARQQGGPLFLKLLPALSAFPWRPNVALAQVYRRDEKTLTRWDELQDADVVGLCSADAHGLIDLALNMRLWNVVLHQPLPEDPSLRPTHILQQIKQGSFHCAAGLLGHQPEFTFTAQRTDGSTVAGGPLRSADVEHLHIRGPQFQQGSGLIVLLRNGEIIQQSNATELRYRSPKPGIYRAEVRTAMPNTYFGERSVPVIYSNQIEIEANN